MLNPPLSSPQNQSFKTLRQFVRKRVPDVEHCELCGVDLVPEHDHLVEPASRRLLCACQACALLFSVQAETKYRRVPRDIQFLSDFRITDAEWDGLMIPINMAFFFYNSPARKTAAMYPSPAGPVESLLNLETWQELACDHAALTRMQPDVEALLVNRLGKSRGFVGDEYYLAPIDRCYQLVGLLRLHWRGLSGGAEVWNEIRAFFADLRQSAKPFQEAQHA